MLNQNFILAGEAVFTIEIPAERQKDFGGAKHYTYRVDKVEANGRWAEAYFVKLLTGPDNTKDYSYLGKLDTFTGQAKETAKSFLAADSNPFRLLNRVLARVWANDNAAFEQFGFRLHHEGACGRCGKRLTRPGPIERGIGDDCAVIMGLAPAPKPRKAKGAAEAKAYAKAKSEAARFDDYLEGFRTLLTTRQVFSMDEVRAAFGEGVSNEDLAARNDELAEAYAECF